MGIETAVDAFAVAAPPRAESVSEFLLAEGHDDAVAFISRGEQHTYAELRRGVATFAGQLAQCGWDRGTPVAIVAPNGPFWAAAYLAVMLAGHVAVPLPTTLPPHEIVARVRWIGARGAILGDRAAVDLAAEMPDDVRVFSAIPEERVEWADRPRVAVDDADDAAYLFTSGTTGDPRAVRLTHGNIRANTTSILGYLPLRDSDRVLVVLPYTYVFGASLLHTHLRVGATLVEQPLVAYPESTVGMLAEHRCTVFAGVPSIYHTLLRNSSFVHRELPDLRIIQQAGGRLPPALLRELSAAHPQASVFVMYGQTEATARLSALPPEMLFSKPGSIGRGIPGVTLRVVDEAGNDIAPGVVGEIRARGANISPGYVGDETASEQKMPDGELHTGDLATVDDERYIYIVDRAEDFIKTWGYRVASQEVEAAAMDTPELIAVAAVGVPDDAAGERIELLAVARPGSGITSENVLARCRRALPKYSVPVRVTFTDKLPLNANGKVVKSDVRALLAAGQED